jgi:exopolyphosphatase/guanosine-5'-triphosphate,3'-diphosphate pyrophosphatase
MQATRRAVIDIGTNSVKLLVAEVNRSAIHPLTETSKQTRLGRGFYTSHELQPSAIAHTAEAVAEFAEQARTKGAADLQIIATSAARDAKNPEDLLRAIRKLTGLETRVISGEQEAEWVYRGVTSDPQLRGEQLLILDVGGGSSEFILGDHGHHSYRQSFQLGAVRLLERLRPSDPPSLSDLANCRQWLQDFFDREIAPPLEARLAGQARQRSQLVGTGGTVTVLARMEHQMEVGFDRERLEGTRLTRSRVLDYMVRLWGCSVEARKRIPGLPASRADVIIMGVAIYEAVLQHFRFEDLYVSTRGLRFGALLDAG